MPLQRAISERGPTWAGAFDFRIRGLLMSRPWPRLVHPLLSHFRPTARTICNEDLSDGDSAMLSRKSLGEARHAGRVMLLWLALIQLPITAAGSAAPHAPPSGPATDRALSHQYVKTVWTTEDGLPQNSVNAILQTRDGYLWVGTFGGLARFDGRKFTIFNTGNTPGLKSNRIVALYEDRAGTLWIGAETGEVMSFKSGVARTFTTRDGLPGSVVWCFHEDAAGTMWIGTGGGLAHWRDGSVTIYTKRVGLVGESVYSICEDQPGHMWLGTNVGLVEFSSEKGVQLPSPSRVTGDPPGGLRTLPGADGSVWLGTEKGLARLVNGQKIRYPQTTGLISQYVRALREDRAGNVWIGYSGDGAANRWRRGKSLDHLERIELGGSGIHAIYSDQEDNVWVGTVGAGLVRLKERRLQVYATEHGLARESVRAMTGDGDDGVWATTDHGLIHISGGREPTLTAYTKKEGLPDYYLLAIYRDTDGTLWTGDPGLTRFKDGVFTVYSSGAGLSEGLVHTIARDHEGDLWVGTETGLNRVRDERAVTYSTADGLVNDDVRFLMPAQDGSLWLGTIGGLSQMRNGVFINYTSEQGLSNNYVRTILEQKDGTLWIGTYGGGLDRFKDGRFKAITVKDGLFDDFISQIIEDDRGRFWILSNRGIFHVTANELNDFADRGTGSITCVSYGIADGMKSSEGNGGNQPAGWRTPDGRLWFATINGLVAIDPDHAGADPPPVKLEQVVLDRQSLPFDKTVEIGPGQESLEIHYTGLSFTRPEQLRFRYRLIGLDQDWVDAGTRRIAYYSHVPPGRYVFSVIAASSDGVWNESGASLGIVVIPPFWKTWWFLSLGLASAAGIGVAAYKRRIELLKKAHAAQEAFSKQLLESQERERQRIAAELHDGLGQSLLIIKNRAFLAASANGNREVTHEQLEEITASASQAIEEVREIAYNLRPYQLDRFGLTRTLQAIFTRFADSSGIQFSAVIDPIDGLFSKDGEISIYRIVQESINNIVKHSSATEATLVINRGAREVDLQIHDNGKGFSPVALASGEARPSGFGLTGMAERVRLLGGTHHIDSAPGQGTTVTIKLRIAEGAL